MGVSSFTKPPLVGGFFFAHSLLCWPRNHVRQCLILGGNGAIDCHLMRLARAVFPHMRSSVMSRSIAAAFLCALLAAHADATAAECKGKPNALGTGRVIAVDPTEHGRIGTMQYAETLPLK